MMPMDTATMELLTRTRYAGSSATRDTSTAPGCLVRIYPAAGLGQVVSLTEKSILIGRDPAAQLSIDDDSVSRRHARIDEHDFEHLVTDLGSTNGTYVNDVRVTTQRLEAGDRIRFGQQIFNYLSASSIEAQYHESVYRMMITDGLTQTRNRRFLMESLERELIRADRRKAPLCVLMMDLDRFKSINDHWGHLAGDAVLVAFVQRTTGLLQGDEILSRYGGEEFALLLPDTPAAEACRLAESIRTTIECAPVPFESHQIPVTVSIGVAEFCENNVRDADDLLALADQMLYVAKQSGRNQVRFQGSPA